MLQNNHFQIAINKYLSQLLQQRYSAHTNIIARITHYLVTESDLKEFSQLLGDIYEIAYTKALNDFHAQLEASGIKVSATYGKKTN